MNFILDFENLEWPPPGSFEANILKSITVPFQEIDNSGGQYPPKPHDPPRPLKGPMFVIDLEGLEKKLCFTKEVDPAPPSEDSSEKK